MVISASVLRLALLMLLCWPLQAQRGDHAGEAQPDLPANIQRTDSPVLSAAEALKLLQVEAGFRVELFAAEPLVVAPVAMTFDELGRLWVVEMRGYMNDVDGHGESDATGCIAVLEDTDGDGRADRRTDFAEGLVLPRALALVAGGVLVLEPPWLRFYEDRDGDLDYERDSIVATGLGGRHSPEHAPNGMVHGLDNWMHWANHPFRARWLNGRLLLEPSLATGQWGTAQDDFGRFVFNSNSDQLHMALVPAHLTARNQNCPKPDGADRRIAKDQRVFPVQITPGINRGYQQGMLQEGRLAQFTGACSPHVHRGAMFPLTHRGNAFVCEPCGNLVHRNLLHEERGAVTASTAQPGTAFLASSDERFRPVALAEGLDGALFVADMARGVIQHRLFVTSFLRRQIVARALEQPTDLGRIWRVVPLNAPASDAPKPGTCTTAGLVALLSHEGGFVRDTAQRLLVQRRDVTCTSALEQLVRTAGPAIPRLHALRCLEGLGALKPGLVLELCADADAALRAEAVLLLESAATGLDPDLLSAALLKLLRDEHPRVRRHTALVLGTIPAATSALRMLLADSKAGELRALALTGLAGREAQWAVEMAGHGDVADLVRCVVAARATTGIELLLRKAAEDPAGRTALLAALERAAVELKLRRPILLSAAPPAPLDAELASCRALLNALQWPGRAGGPALPPGLDARGAALLDQGRTLFAQHCAGCHQADGRGSEGVAAALRGSPRLGSGDASVPLRIVLQGFSTSASAGGGNFGTEMPSFARLADAELAAVLTFARRSFGHEESAVHPETVAQSRITWAAHSGAWTPAELDSGSPPR